MTTPSNTIELANGIRISGAHASRVREWILSAARQLDFQTIERDGFIVFDNMEIALKVVAKAVELSGAQVE
jgi:hypothetical protein